MKLERAANTVGSFLVENASIECWGLKRPFRVWIRTCSFGEIQTSQNRKVKATCVVTEAIIVVGHHPEMMLLCSRRLFMWGKQWEAITQSKPEWPCNYYTTSPDTRRSSRPGLNQMKWEIQEAELNFNHVISHDIKGLNASASATAPSD